MADTGTCPYCRGAKVLDSAIHGHIACRVCLGTGAGIYENNLGHNARPRELRRIAELIGERDLAVDAIDALLVEVHGVG